MFTLLLYNNPDGIIYIIMAYGAFSPECGVDLGFDVPHLWTEELLALDMDRTLVDSDKCAAGLEKVSGWDFSADKAAVESGGGTFQAMEAIQESMSEAEFAAMAERLMAGSPNEYNFADTAAFLRRIGGTVTVPNMVITYGTSPVWQALKTYLSGYRGYLEVMDDPNKGPHIEDWRGPSGTFDFIGMDLWGVPKAIYHARSVKLVDDKAGAFSELPPDTTGAYLKRRGERVLKSQGTEVVEAVRDRVDTIDGLGKISLRSNLHADCGSRGLPNRTRDIAVFKPAYYGKKQKPGIIIRGNQGFADIEAQLDKAYSAA